MRCLAKKGETKDYALDKKFRYLLQRRCGEDAQWISSTPKLTCRAGSVAKISEVVRGHVQRLVLACAVVVNVTWSMDLPNGQ